MRAHPRFKFIGHRARPQALLGPGRAAARIINAAKPGRRKAARKSGKSAKDQARIRSSPPGRRAGGIFRSGPARLAHRAFRSRSRAPAQIAVNQQPGVRRQPPERLIRPNWVRAQPFQPTKKTGLSPRSFSIHRDDYSCSRNVREGFQSVRFQQRCSGICPGSRRPKPPFGLCEDALRGCIRGGLVPAVENCHFGDDMAADPAEIGPIHSSRRDDQACYACVSHPGAVRACIAIACPDQSMERLLCRHRWWLCPCQAGLDRHRTLIRRPP